nr:MAG TPA: hypothetical protein [Caudoviricetes sp.]
MIRNFSIAAIFIYFCRNNILYLHFSVFCVMIYEKCEITQ